MLARSRRVRLQGGADFETPLLVPSLSSKGFAPVEVEGKDVPAPAAYFQQFVDGLTEALLISAYDIHYEQIADAKQLRHNFASSAYSRPAVLFIDSGWYEIQQGSDAGAPYEQTLKPGDWTEERYVATIDGLAEDLRAVVVGWDREEATYGEQIAHAQRFQRHRPGAGTDQPLPRRVEPGGVLEWGRGFATTMTIGVGVVLGHATVCRRRRSRHRRPT